MTGFANRLTAGRTGVVASLVVVTIVFAACSTSSTVVNGPPGPCPSRVVALHNTGAHLREKLIPIRTNRARLCLYSGLPASPAGPASGSLVSSKLMTEPHKVETLRESLNNLPARPSGTINCPNDRGGAV